MIKFIVSLFTHKFELVQNMCKLVQRMTQTNQIIASLFSNKFKLFQDMCKLVENMCKLV